MQMKCVKTTFIDQCRGNFLVWIYWRKQICLSYNSTMIVQNITYVFILPYVQVLKKLWVLNVQISCNLFNFCSFFVENDCSLHKFFSEYFKCSRLETNLYAVCRKEGHYSFANMRSDIVLLEKKSFIFCF